MFYIDSEKDKPSLTNMMLTVEECMEEGIRLGDTTELREKLRSTIENTAWNLKTIYGIQNPNSSAQVIAALKALNDQNVEDCCVIEESKKAADGSYGKVLKWTSNSDALSRLIHMDYDIAKQLIIYRRATKYAECIDRFKSFADKDGLVHPTVTFGKTNRVNYSQPDLMNIPKKILWDVVVPRGKGNVLISIDIKNQEPWILVNMLGIESLKDIIESSPDSLYDVMIKQWFGSDFQYTKLQRDEFKTYWNALTYGCAKKLGPIICRNIDYEVVYKNFKAIQELDEYCKKCRAQGFSGRYRQVKTYFGTEITCDGAKGTKLSNQLMDTPVQGTGSDILALLIEYFQDRALEEQVDQMVWIYYTRHDEIVIEVDFMLIEIKGMDWVLDFLKETFEHKIDNWVPFRVDIDIVEAEPLYEEDYTNTEDDSAE